MWAAVSKAILYLSTMMSKLFDTVGATAHERSPFCHSFSSLVDLRDDFIHYIPCTVNYEDVRGSGCKQTSDETEGSTAPSEESIVDR
eukprot:9011043-Ditylum_brightwellii.AAC.1